MTLAFCDTETFSTVNLKTDGTWAYAEKAEVMLFTYAKDDEPAECWDLTTGAAMPSKLEDLIFDERVMSVWHNAGFDRTVLKFAQPAIYDALPLTRWHCTMAQALAHSLPGSLDALCEILNVAAGDRKLKTGKDLIQLFCKPPAKNMKRERATRLTHPVEWANFVEYAKQDIPSMRAIYHKIPMWNYSGAEHRLWQEDMAINERGFCVDLDLAHAAIRAVNRTQADLSARTLELTHGEVAKTTQRDKLLVHLLAEYGVDLPDLTKGTLERRIDDQALPGGLRELLKIRLQASASSTSKYNKLLKAASSDGRLRGTLQYCGAARTGRWAGRVFQPHNLMRPSISNDEINFGIEAMKADCEDIMYDNVMEVASSAMRGSIISAPGKKLVLADWSNVEGRGLAWLAGETWKLQAFRDFDNGKSPDLYKVAYAKSFGIDARDIGDDDPRRQVGKVQELALGFAGGVGAFATFSLVYNIDLEAMARKAWAAIPPHIKDEAAVFYEWMIVKQKRSDFGLSKKAYIVCESFKRLWRYAHPRTNDFWPELENAVISATCQPGEIFKAGKLRVRRTNAWLRVQLPSGRFLCYPHPKVEQLKGGKMQFSYVGSNPYSRKWGRIKTYGGKLAENATQAACRDFVADALMRCKQKEYPIVLHVHDELIAEVPDTAEFSADRLSEIMCTPPIWAADFPLVAKGFETYRYRK